jgi:hypothetical protein
MAKPNDAAFAGGEIVRTQGLPDGQRFAVNPGYDPATRTVTIVAATETPCLMPGWIIGIDERQYYEVLDCRAEAVDLSHVEAGNAPLLDAHNRWSMDDRLGGISSVRFENGNAIAVATMAQNDRAVAIAAELEAGGKLKASVGYRRLAMQLERMEGDIPVYRVTRWMFRECSFVPIAADPNAGVRADGDIIHPCTIMENRAMSQSNENGGAAPANANGQDGVRTENEAGAGAGSPASAGQGEGQRGEPAPSRVARFSATTALAFVDQARAFGDDVVNRANELIAQNERGEITVETARSTLLAEAASAQRAQTGGLATGGRAIEITQDERDKFVHGASVALMKRAGVLDTVVRAAKMKGETFDANPGEFASIRNVELARMCLDKAGIRCESYDRDEIIKAAMVGTRSGANTTSDFPVIFENAMHKTLQSAYMVAPNTWRTFCGVSSVNDFREHPRYLRGSIGNLQPKTQAGEFKVVNVPDGAKEKISVTTKGFIIILTREAIKNDDLGAFSDMAMDIGIAAARSIETDVYAALAANSGAGPLMNDGQPLFHSSHNNIAAVSAAPSVASFDALWQQFGQQRDVSGNDFLDIMPSVFLGPNSLKTTARKVNENEYDPDVTSKFQVMNTSQGTFDLIVTSPRLGGTAWYGFADPNLAPALEVAFLEGMQEPKIESQEGWRTDGIEWKAVHDWGVAGMNWRSAIRNPGA